MNPLHRQILQPFLERLELIEQQVEKLGQSIANALKNYHAAVLRLAQVPGYGADSAQQVIGEVGPEAATFPSSAPLASAEVSTTDRCLKGNRQMRQTLTQVPMQRSIPRGAYSKLCSVAYCHAWDSRGLFGPSSLPTYLEDSHQGIHCEETGSHPDPKLVKERTRKLIRELRGLGYAVQLTPLIASATTPLRESQRLYDPFQHSEPRVCYRALR